MILKPKHKAFMEQLPLNGNNVYKSALKAGYTKSYAHSSGKLIVKNAIKETAKELIQSVNKDITPQETKQLMCEIMGLSPQMVLNTLNKIATQDKDYSSALKVLSPLSKELGVDISTQEQQNITVPVLNIVVDKPNNKDITEIDKIE
jgi:hypothetical protein